MTEQVERMADSLLTPDRLIGNLNDLLDVFPERAPYQPAKVYDASLSTMWAIRNFPTLAEFCEFARRAGFAGVEMNHKIDSAMLASVDLSRYSVRSIHEPCPADIAADTLKKQDWLISSLDETKRREGIKSIQRSIDLAYQLGTRAIVVHAGHSQNDHGLEKQLRALFNAGMKDSREYSEIKAQIIRTRAELAAPGFEAVQKSLRELLEYARPYNICIGLENRFHYLEYPSPDELEILLGLAGPGQAGFIFDVGHAYHLSRLGFYPHEEWLERFAPRIIGTHLHDVAGLQDHLAPGLGDVNFDRVASYLPETAFRTCEFLGSNTPEQVIAGLKFLVEHGCIAEQK